VCCSVSQCVAVCCSVSQCVAGLMFIAVMLLLHVVVCCSVSQCVLPHIKHVTYSRWHGEQKYHGKRVAVCCSMLQCDAVFFRTSDMLPILGDRGKKNTTGSVLWCVAVCCSVLQCIFTRQTCYLFQVIWGTKIPREVCCGVLQYVAVCCCVFSHARHVTYSRWHGNTKMVPRTSQLPSLLQG